MTQAILESLLGLRGTIERLEALGTPVPADRVQARWERLTALHGTDLDFGRVAVVADRIDAVAARYAERGAQTVSVSTLSACPPGTLRLVYCHELLHRHPDPLGLLGALRRLLIPNGGLLVSGYVLADPEVSTCLRMVSPGTSDWRFVPGPLAARWLLRDAGFDHVEEVEDREGPREPFPVRDVVLHAVSWRSGRGEGGKSGNAE